MLNETAVLQLRDGDDFHPSPMPSRLRLPRIRCCGDPCISALLQDLSRCMVAAGSLNHLGIFSMRTFFRLFLSITSASARSSSAAPVLVVR